MSTKIQFKRTSSIDDDKRKALDAAEPLVDLTNNQLIIGKAGNSEKGFTLGSANLAIGDTATSTSDSTNDVSDPYLNLVNPDTISSKQVKGTSGNISVSGKDGIITIKDVANYTDTAEANKYVSKVDQIDGKINVTRSTLLETTTSETVGALSNGSLEVITSIGAPDLTKGASPKKRKIKGNAGIEVVTKDSESDISVQHTNSVTAKDNYQKTATKSLLTGDNFTIVEEKYDAQGHITESATSTLTLPKIIEGNGITISTSNTNEYTISAKPGSGITVTEDGINHYDTSTQATVTNDGRTYIQSIELDTYGHVTQLNSATETVTDTNTWRPVQLDGTEKLSSEITSNALNLKAGTNITIEEDDGTFTFNSSYIDTNQKVKVDRVTFGNDAEVEFIGSGSVTVSADSDAETITISGTNTDTKVTSAANHYTPEADDASKLEVDASSTVTATWGATSIVTGVNISRDSKGHITDLTVDSIKLGTPDGGDGNDNTAHYHRAGTGLVLDGDDTGGINGTVTYSIDVGTGNAGKCLKVDSSGTGVEWGTVSSSDEKVKQERIPTTGVTATYYLLGSYLNTDATSEDLTNLVRVSSVTLSNYGKDLTTDGTIKASTFNATSDSRLKENFEEFILEKSILDLPVYKFDFIDGLKNQIGCKAQDLQEICPEIVSADENGFLSIQESKLIYLLLDEVKSLKNQVSILSDKLAKLS